MTINTWKLSSFKLILFLEPFDGSESLNWAYSWSQQVRVPFLSSIFFSTENTRKENNQILRVSFSVSLLKTKVAFLSCNQCFEMICIWSYFERTFYLAYFYKSFILNEIIAKTNNTNLFLKYLSISVVGWDFFCLFINIFHFLPQILWLCQGSTSLSRKEGRREKVETVRYSRSKRSFLLQSFWQTQRKRVIARSWQCNWILTMQAGSHLKSVTPQLNLESPSQATPSSSF